AELEAIADGVPARFPLADAHFFYGPVPALELAADAGPARRTRGDTSYEVAAAEIVVYSARGNARRDTRLGVGVICDPPPADHRALPPLPAQAQALLGALGAVA